MAGKITGNHSGPLNMRAAFVLNGVWEGDASALVDLMRSGEPIDPQTREAIADALERQNGVRLEFHRGNEKAFLTLVETRFRHQEIADEFDRLTAQGVPKQKAYQLLIDQGLAKSDRAIDNARKQARESAFRITRVRK